ncbi:hypothetical protein AGMMS50233_09650 [Endomicrobiia bacterium]|nr:hypothetical protein AGMMS50233_09650 [Endomicrobiia bacterium]
MGLVLMGVKKETFDKTKDNKEERKKGEREVSKEKISLPVAAVVSPLASAYRIT